MFLDEPTVGADVQSRAGILDIVRSMAERGAAVVYTTHYLTELEQLDADVAVLHGGRVVVRGALSDVVGRYASASVALRFAFLNTALVGTLFFREHAWGTWDRLRASSASTMDIALGKVLPLCVCQLAQLGVLFLAGRVCRHAGGVWRHAGGGVLDDGPGARDR